MALDLHENGLNTPPPSSTASVYRQSKHSASPRTRPENKHGKRKERDAEHHLIPSINTTGYPRSRNFLPPSPELTSTSGQSAVHDARMRYESHTPDPTPRSASKSVYDEQTDIEVVIELDSDASGHDEGPKTGRDDKVGPVLGSHAVDRIAAVTTGKSTSKSADLKKHKRKSGEQDDGAIRVKSKSKKKRKDEGRDPGTVRPSTFGIMAGPKKVTTYESRPQFDPSVLQHGERAHKRPRLDEEGGTKVRQEDKTAMRNSMKKDKGKSAVSHAERDMVKNDHSRSLNPPVAPPKNIVKLKLKKSTAVLPEIAASQTIADPRNTPGTRLTIVERTVKKTKLTRTTLKLKPGPVDIDRSGDDTSEASQRLRTKDPIKYYAKRSLVGKTAITIPSGPKSKGKAVRKKINVGGECPVVRSRQPSPFPAWHRTTAVLNRFGVPQAETKEVDEIPEDNCYVLIPIYEAKTKLVQPELVPERFDVRSNHPALQMNELLRRGMPVACQWGDCDAVLACETMLEKHVHRSGHVRKALIIPREHYEPDAWICQWDGCEGKAFAEEAELEQHVKAVHVSTTLHCPYAGCGERPEGYEKMSFLAAHIRKSNHLIDGELRPLIGANDNKAPPKRHAEPVPESSEKHKSVYVPVARAVWRYEQRKKAVIDLVSDQSFIDRLDVKMQAGNLEMNINIGSDPENNDTTEDDEIDSVVPEIEEVWLDREPDSELGSDETGSREDGGGASSVNRETTGTEGDASRVTTPNPAAQKRRSTRRIEMGQKSMEPPSAKTLGNPRDMGYCVLIPVTREWVALPCGPESM